VATCFSPSGPSSGHTVAASQAKLYVILQIKIYNIVLHEVRKFQINIKILTSVVNMLQSVHKNVYFKNLKCTEGGII
jgi:hypothetical protein